MAAETISFARGAPSADILPHDAVREAAARALEGDWAKALSYGTGIGHPGLCEWIAERHGGLDAAQVMVANGSLEAGVMLFEHLLSPGDRVVVEQPTYDRTLLILQRIGVELVPVPLEADGIDVGALEAALAEGPVEARPHHPQRAQPGRLHALGGQARAPGRARRRARLLDLRGRPLSRASLRGRAAGDDAGARPRRPGPPRLLLLEDGQPRASGSATWPGRRAEIAKLAKRANETYISPNMLAESIVLELCRSGALDRNIEFVKGELQARCDALVAALREQIPEAEFVVPEGGYFLWLDLAAGTDTVALLAEAKSDAVSFVAGPDFMIEGGSNSLRLSFAPVPADQAAEGVRRIAAALERLRS